MGNFEDWHLELSQSCLVHGYLRFEPKSTCLHWEGERRVLVAVHGW